MTCGFRVILRFVRLVRGANRLQLQAVALLELILPQLAVLSLRAHHRNGRRTQRRRRMLLDSDPIILIRLILVATVRIKCP